MEVIRFTNLRFLGVKMLFLDPNKPIATCVSKSCTGCPVEEKLHCHFTPKDLIHFLLITLPSFLIGGAGVYHLNGWMLKSRIQLR